MVVLDVLEVDEFGDLDMQTRIRLWEGMTECAFFTLGNQPGVGSC